MADNKVELNLDEKVTVKNIAGWKVTFARIEGIGDISIPADGVTKLTRNEIISQVQNGNKLFSGVRGDGNHPTLFINDALTRREVGFESEDGSTKQIVFDDKIVKNIFSIKKQEAFQDAVKNTIKVRAEKYAIIQAIKRLKINDYSKIRFVEDYTGFKVQ